MEWMPPDGIYVPGTVRRVLSERMHRIAIRCTRG